MTDREFIEWMRDQCDAQLGTAPGPDPDVDSPTGRKPRLCWTSNLQRSYNRMLAEYDAGEDTLGAIWCDLIFDNARGDRYGDYTGIWAWEAYQITGDVAWVEQAWEKVEKYILNGSLSDTNGNREFAIERVIAFDWLWPGLTEERRTQFFEALDRMFTNAGILNGTIRTTDSDQSTGIYFAVVAYALAFGDVHPKALEFFNAPIVGGLVPTDAGPRATLRNAIYDYVANMGKGGEWIESSEYNLGTVRMLMMGWACARTASGVEHFPEIVEWAAAAALRYTLMTTPDRAQSFQWGDEQHPRKFQAYMWTSTAMLFNHPVARRYVYDLVAHYGPRGYQSGEPIGRGFLLFDAYGPQATTDVRVLDARGQGLVSARTSHDPAASMLCAHFAPGGQAASPAVDHAVNYFGDLQLWRRNQWALTHPICYGGVGNNGWGTNGMLHRGIGAPKQWRGSVQVHTGVDWLFMAGTSGGTILASKFYQPPPVFWHEWSRSVLWIDGDVVDTLIVFDRTHADDPTKLPSFARYPDDIEKKMNEHPLRLWRWHMPVIPTLGPNSATWAIGDEQARVTWLRPDLVPAITDQSVAWAAINMEAREKKFHLDLSEPTNRIGFQTLITVLEFGDPTQFSSLSLLVDTEASAQAVQLTCAGRPDWLVLFNALPGPRLPNCDGVVYNPQTPGLLEGVRYREFPLPPVSARVWGMETATGLPMLEP